MRKNLIGYITFLLMLNFISANAIADNHFKISGDLINCKAAKVYLRYGDGKFKVYMDSVEVTNGHYEISGEIPYGQKVLITDYDPWALKAGEEMFKKMSTGLKFIFLAPGEYHLIHKDIFKNAEITGPPALQDFDAIEAIAERFEETRNQTRSLAYAASAKKDSIAYKKLAEQYAQSEFTEGHIYGKFIEEHSTNPVSFYAFEKIKKMTNAYEAKDLKELFLLLPKVQQETQAGKEFREELDAKLIFNKNGAIGSQAPDFALPDTAGKIRRVSEFKGKYVLVDFWASWCGPCRADNPHLLAAYKEFHGKGFEILSVSLDVKKAEKRWLAAIRQDGIGAWAHVADLNAAGDDGFKNQAVKLYGIQAIPQNFLIDPNGNIIGKSLRGGALEKMLAEVIK